MSLQFIGYIYKFNKTLTKHTEIIRCYRKFQLLAPGLVIIFIFENHHANVGDLRNSAKPFLISSCPVCLVTPPLYVYTLSLLSYLVSCLVPFCLVSSLPTLLRLVHSHFISTSHVSPYPITYFCFTSPHLVSPKSILSSSNHVLINLTLSYSSSACLTPPLFSLGLVLSRHISPIIQHASSHFM